MWMIDPMDEVWTRIERELESMGKNPAWLARELGMDPQRVYNWGRRRVPPDAYKAIAAVIGKSYAWMVNDTAQPASGLSPMALRIGQEFDRIEGEADKLAAFAYIIGVIARSSGAAPVPPAMRPGLPPKPEPGHSR